MLISNAREGDSRSAPYPYHTSGKALGLANSADFAYKSDVELRTRIENNIRANKLLEEGATALLGISGGVDSMVLLHLLQELAPQNNWSLSVGHFNHCLRGKESDADEAFVREAADRLTLPFRSSRSDVRAFAVEKGISIEMAGRELRHRFFIETAAACGADRIALAHHADDNVETFWLRLLRGDVGRGLAGIRWERSAGPGTDIRFIRPLLNISKRDLLQYANERNLSFREDASNADPAFLRNQLRLELLPKLEEFQPAIRDITLRTVEVLGAEKAFLEAEAQRWLSERKQSFGELHLALQREVVRQQILQFGIQPSFELIEELRLKPDCPISFSPTQWISRSTSGLLQRDPNLTSQRFFE